MNNYRKKPVVVQALQLDTSSIKRLPNILGAGVLKSVTVNPKKGTFSIQIKTLEGVMRGSPGDWLIKGVAGEFYFCRNDIFEKTYEAVI
jgi:hypothetical protein